MRAFEKSKNVLKLLSEAVSEGILLVSEQQIIIGTNTRTNEMFGYGEGELKGQPLHLLIPESFHNAHDKYVEDFHKKQGQRRMAHGRTLFGKRMNGEEFPIEVGLNPFSLLGKTYVMALVIDVSEKKEQERQIRELNSRLEEKIEARTKELEKTVVKLTREIKLRENAESKIKSALHRERELNDLKTEFLSLVSHEFKTPLSGILTSATLVGKYSRDDQQDKREKHLNTIISGVHHLNGILNDFLSVERLEKGKEVYRYTDFSLSKVVNEVVYNANMLLKDGQKIIYPENIDEIDINQDERIVSLVLTNLLHNAIKYSPEETDIDIKVELLPSKIVFHIIDLGIGIPEKNQKHIFERYYRAENARLIQGTGIGLNIVKVHVENIGGAIYFKSKSGKGSVFSVEFPLEHNAG
ncbi:Adaptive-response sensory-kinase SasA [Arenibacter antarcticus]|uniref:histidine kinase n=1 Tax=Arenibacter antarcticus TaxID=2040469 RepID=A0ABW5VD83_9FLAO|nr:PAS domain-containing sensor histidine kinase [Arenibacter sp. H213]MCM4169344.1 PAS domain-containing sensor histidine kinase [Arenibacter sp. H213]